MKEQTLVKIIKSLIFISLISPLIVSRNFFFPFIVPKTIFFQISIEIALFFYILLAIAYKRYAPTFDILTKSVLVFFSVYVLAGIFGENFSKSFFGNYERMLGIFNLAHFIVLFLMVKSVFIKEKEWTQLLRFSIIVSILISLYGIGQKIGLPFLYHSGIDRVDATIGNAAFLGGYLIFNVFFAIFLLLKDKKEWKYLYGISIFLNLIAIYFSATRGAILGILLGFLFLGFAVLIYNRKNIANILNFKKNTTLRFTVAGVVVFLILAFLNQNAFREPVGRILSISLKDSTVKSRILAAGVSWHGFLEHPVLGWGPENYNFVFDKYYDPRLHNIEQWFDHAHNIIFDVLVSAGVVGFISYIAIFAISLYLLFKISKRSKDDFATAYIFIAFLIAYFFQNIFVFDSLVTYQLFFIFLALLAYLTQEGGVKELKYNARPLPIQAVVISGAVILFTVYSFNIKPAMAANYLIKALSSSQDTKLAFDNFEKSINTSLPSGKPELRARLVDSVAEASQDKDISQENKKIFFDLALSESRKTIEENPKDFRYHLYFLNLFKIDSDNQEILKETDNILSKAEDLAPNKPILYTQWGQVKIKLGRYDEAILLLEKSISLHMDNSIAANLISLYKLTNQKEKAIAMYDKIFGASDISAQSYKNMAVDMMSLIEKERAIKAAEKAIELDPSLSEEGRHFIQSLQ